MPTHLAGHPGHHQLQDNFSFLWQRCLPFRFAEWLLHSVWGTEWCGGEEDHGCVQRMCRPAGRCSYRHLQHLSEQRRRSNMLQGYHHRHKKSSVSYLNDYRPIVLTSTIMKCFERLVMRHIKTQLLPSPDPLQFVFGPNSSTDDTIAPTLHLAFTHLDKKDSYVRSLSFWAWTHPSVIGSWTSWLGDFCQSGSGTASPPPPPHWALGPPRAVCSVHCCSLLAHDCAAMHSSNRTVKFTDDTTVVGLFS